MKKNMNREMIRNLIEFQPSITNARIAEVTGLSRQLVSYHARGLKIPRSTPNRTSSFCHNRIQQRNKSGLCKRCKPLAYCFEYQCSYCGEVWVAEGRDASQRRYRKNHSKYPELDFCGSKCSGRYFFERNHSLPEVKRT